MKPSGLLSIVDRLPTITEMQESDTDDGDKDCLSHTMEEYMDSIKELGHRYWVACRRRVAPSVFCNSCRIYTPWISVDLSDVALTLMDPSNCDMSLHFKQNPLDRLVAQSLFAGLV
ncbi:hypothetical protein Q5P01_026031 [Channa striata]|uniref:Uncharacterized protein n=1 Tax=Channa striata TaxID=64152 RepID=A0AA88LN79_CHASR|nr:hypothetical protein Q5P01_026031 [Channa striata]